jgi:hypothetical protein
VPELQVKAEILAELYMKTSLHQPYIVIWYQTDWKPPFSALVCLDLLYILNQGELNIILDVALSLETITWPCATVSETL